MHHGGRLIHKYNFDGIVTYFDYLDKDKMLLTEIECMAVCLSHIGRIDYWYRVQDEGTLKRVEFDSEVIERCENMPEVRMINMYMDHRDKLDDALNSQTGSNVYCRYSSQVYDYADDVRTLNVILEDLPEFIKAIVLHDGLDKATSNEVQSTWKPTRSMNSASSKGKEKVAEVDEGCVQHETKKANSKGKEKVIEVDEGNRPGKKHKAKAAIGTSIPASKPGNYEAEIERKNQLREKTKQRAKVLKEKRDKKKVEAAATSVVDSSNPTGVVRKRAKCSNTRCNNYASIQESQSGV
ncbi:hypothetical protein ACE6H2_001817 [Prunus campanulata]